MRTCKVFWTNEATLDLEGIIGYISQDRTASAISLYKIIKSKCLLLNNNPDKYRIVPELFDLGITNYREIVHSPYRIIYRLTSLEVHIMAVVDSRRDFEAFIFNRLLRDRSAR